MDVAFLERKLRENDPYAHNLSSFFIFAHIKSYISALLDKNSKEFKKVRELKGRNDGTKKGEADLISQLGNAKANYQSEYRKLLTARSKMQTALATQVITAIFFSETKINLAVVFS